MKVLVICGHPHLEQSVANAAMLEEYKQNSDVEIRRIGDLYPDFKINVAEEQKALLEADVIVWQFPVYWYGLPSIMKKWQEDVLAHGFAYGSGAKLGGKKLVVSATTGSPVDAYQPGQPQQHTLDDLFIPLHQCAAMCGLEYVETFHLGGMICIPGVTTEEEKNRQRAAAKEQAVKVMTKVKSLK